MIETGFVKTRYLADTAWVALRLEDPSLRIFDCTLLYTPSPANPVRTHPVTEHWPLGHIPGAGFLDLKGELTDLGSRWPLQNTIPRPRQFSDVMGRHGVGPGTQVVLYSAQHPMAAARVWWMLHAYGFDDAAILDGGWGKWVAEGRPVSTDDSRYPTANFEGHARPGAIASKADVRAALDDPNVLLINALSQEQHVGGGVHFGRPGRIPGSRCVPALAMLNPRDGTLRPLPELRQMFAAVGLRDGMRAITYCGNGIASSCAAFVLSMLGVREVSVYGGSLAEWSNDPSLPLEFG